MRKNGTLNYLIGDHLGSTSLVTDASGNVINQTQYKAWGEERYSSGTKQTGYGYTGQYSYASDFGLHYYNARWYDSSLGRFAQADTIVPSGVQGYDRYAYVNNNPVKYTDPTGHRCAGGGDENIWGYCGDTLPAPNKVTTYQNAYLGAVARKYGIQLAPLDRWEYKEYVKFEQDGVSGTIGWTPSRENDPYYDKSGDLKSASDASVILTQKGLDFCGIEVACVGALLAHEATHSWIEFKIENTSTTGEPRVSKYTHAEEMLADTVALRVGDPTGIITEHFNKSAEDCKAAFTSPCSNPLEMIEDAYGIDLSNISNLVFGK